MTPVSPPLPAPWKDITSYSRDDTVRTPKSFEARITTSLRLVVTRHQHYPPDVWLMCCSRLGVDLEALDAKDRNAALKEAEQRLLGTLDDLRTSVLNTFDFDL